MSEEQKDCDHIDIRAHRGGGMDFALLEVKCGVCGLTLWSRAPASPALSVDALMPEVHHCCSDDCYLEYCDPNEVRAALVAAVGGGE